MNPHEIDHIKRAIAFMEDHLEEKLDLGRIAGEMHYSKYYLHKMFSQVTGVTVHDYIFRRRLTEAARSLAFSGRSVLDISLHCGYDSQQAFTAAFTAMYKLPPAGFRRRKHFYPLQLRYTPRKDMGSREITGSQIDFAGESDIPAWMDLTDLVVDGYPHLDKREHMRNLRECIAQRRALIVREAGTAAGVMAFSRENGRIEFLGIHPQYRRSNMAKLFLDKLTTELLPDREISITTYRDGDRADTGHRRSLERLGFAGRELLVEFGYPTQRFVFFPGGRADNGGR